jgi:hypothetical protein
MSAGFVQIALKTSRHKLFNGMSEFGPVKCFEKQFKSLAHPKVTSKWMIMVKLKQLKLKLLIVGNINKSIETE